MNTERGFTLPELIIVMVLSTMLSAILFGFAIDYSRYGSTIQSNSVAFVERLNASDFLRENIGLSSGLINQTSIHDDHALVQDPYDPEHWILIRAVKGTFGNNSSVTPLVYFKKFSRNSNRDVVYNGVKPYEDEYVIYHDGAKKEVRVRTLANPDAKDVDGTSMATTSCPIAYVTDECPEDKLLISDIISIGLRYFSRSGNEITYNSIDDLGIVPCTAVGPLYTGCAGADFPSAEVIEITLNLSKRPDGVGTNSTQSATIIRVALRNK